MFEGVHTALVTPFRNGDIDEDAFRKLIDVQLEAGIKGLVPVGTTGESPTLSSEEHLRVVQLCVEHNKGRGLVIAGTGSNSTREAIHLTQEAEKAGADAALLVCPYYNKPSQEGLFAHFQEIAKSTKLPIILYSIPGRCGIEIGVEVTARLAEACPNIVAMKEAGGTPERVSQLKDLCPASFEVLSGDDSMTLPFMSVGAVGVISVASNLIPSTMVELVAAANAGDYRKASKIHRLNYPLFSAMLKLDTNPVPIKAALAMTGAIRDEVRLPLVRMDETKRSTLEGTLLELGII